MFFWLVSGFSLLGLVYHLFWEENRSIGRYFWVGLGLSLLLASITFWVPANRAFYTEAFDVQTTSVDRTTFTALGGAVGAGRISMTQSHPTNSYRDELIVRLGCEVELRSFPFTSAGRYRSQRE